MKLTSYFAESVQAALDKARLELGPEAMLLHSRTLSAEQKHLGAYEVVFGTTSDLTRKPDVVLKRPAPPSSVPGGDALLQEITELRRHIEFVRNSLEQNPAAQRSPRQRRSPDTEKLHAQLIAADFSEQLAEELIEGVEKRAYSHASKSAGPFMADVLSLERLQTLLVEELQRRFEVRPELGKSENQRRIVMLVGPPGAGKTTTLVKLAVRYGLATRTPMRLLSADTLRMGGSEQLAAHARIIGAEFQPLHTAAALGQALQDCRGKKLVLIDTPGYAPGDMEDAGYLAGFVREHSEIEVQLVLPAFLRCAPAYRFVERFAQFRPSKLLFTHLDEVETPGTVLEQAIKTQLPLSFLANGQAIPEDIQDASKPWLTAGLRDHARALAHSAA